jgi:hypothetical protein
MNTTTALTTGSVLRVSVAYPSALFFDGVTEGRVKGVLNSFGEIVGSGMGVGSGAPWRDFEVEIQCNRFTEMVDAVTLLGIGAILKQEIQVVDETDDDAEDRSINEATDRAFELVLGVIEDPNPHLLYSVFLAVLNTLIEQGMSVDDVVKDTKGHLTLAYPTGRSESAN